MTPPDGIDSSRALWNDLREYNASRMSRVVARGQGVPSWGVAVDVPLVKGGQGRSDAECEWYSTLTTWLSLIAVAGGFAAVVWILWGAK